MPEDAAPRTPTPAGPEPAPAQRQDRTGRVVGHALSGVLCALAAITLLANAAVTSFITPKFVEIFEDFDTDLPTLTIAIIRARVWIAVISLALAALMIVKEVCIRHPAAKLIINGLVFGAALLLVPLTVIGLFLPLVTLMQPVP